MNEPALTIEELRIKIQTAVAMARISDEGLVQSINDNIEALRSINTDLSIQLADMLMVQLIKAQANRARIDRTEALKALVVWAGSTRLGWL